MQLQFSLGRNLLFLLLSLPALTFSQGAFEYYLDVPGIPGDANQSGYQNQICVTSFSYEVRSFEDPDVIMMPGGAAVRAKQSFLRISKALDRATPELFLAVVSGTTYNSVVLSVLSPDLVTGTSALLTRYTLEDAVFAAVEQGGDTGSAPGEVVSLVSAKITVTHYSPSGQVTSERFHNFRTNTSG